MYLQYNKLDDNAAEKGLLRVKNNQIREVQGATSPYLKQELFAVAPQSVSFDSNNASFTFNRQTLFTNSNVNISKLEVNFNNESGYITAGWNTPISYSFSAGGQKTIWFRVTFADGRALTSRTNIEVMDSQRMKVPSIEYKEYVVNASLGHSGGTIQVIYSQLNKTGKLIRPLIIAEEADMPFLNERVDLGTLLGNNMIKELSVLYDLVYVKNNNGLDDIIRNAKVFEEAIEWVNANRYFVADSNYVVGIGMGGLVAQYALSSLEKSGKKHNVCKFISINAPHKGANFPLGLQAAIRHIQDIKLAKVFIEDVSTQAKKIGNLLNSKAIRQMLVYCIDRNFNYTNDHAVFMQQYEAMGAPQQCRNIALSSGSQNGWKLFDPGVSLLQFDESYPLSWLDFFIIPGKTNLKADIWANALSHKKATQIYKGKIVFKKQVLGFIPVSITINSRSFSSQANMLALDGAPGGTISISDLFDKGSNLSNMLKQPSFCFVPTASALGFDNWSGNVLSSLDLDDEYVQNHTSFDKCYAPSNNKSCIDLKECADFWFILNLQ